MAGSNGTSKGTAKGSKSAGGLTANAGGFGVGDRAEIDSWPNTADELEQMPSLSPKQKIALIDSSEIASMISSKADKYPENFISVRDSKGKLQASAYVESRKDSLYLSLLTSAPWNVVRIPGDERAVKGAGTAAIVAVIKESIKRGYGGKVQLAALPGAVPFYEKLGFKKVAVAKSGEEKPSGMPKFSLSAGQAQKILKMHSGI